MPGTSFRTARPTVAAPEVRSAQPAPPHGAALSDGAPIALGLPLEDSYSRQEKLSPLVARNKAIRARMVGLFVASSQGGGQIP